MRIAVVNLTNGGLSGGYRKYLQKLLPLLRDDPHTTNLTVFAPEPVADAIRTDTLPVYGWHRTNSQRGFASLQAQLREVEPQVVFIPTARWLNCGATPTVVMVQNMEPLTIPFDGNSIFESARNLARAYVARRACQRAQRVIAVSRYVQEFLVARWGIRVEKIGIVYHGVEPAPPREQTIKPATLDGIELGAFLFTVGSIRPARGLEDALRAFALLTHRLPKLSLVIGGKTDQGTEFYARQMQHLARGLGISERVVWTGQLNELEMSWCYHHCDAFVMTSRAEACPNIALEALSHCCQIVSTAHPPMPEFFGESALYYQPRDADDFAQKLARVLDASPEERLARRDAAQARARIFTWANTLQGTMEQLNLALSGQLK